MPPQHQRVQTLCTLSETQVKGSTVKKYFEGGIRNSLSKGFNGLFKPILASFIKEGWCNRLLSVYVAVFAHDSFL